MTKTPSLSAWSGSRPVQNKDHANARLGVNLQRALAGRFSPKEMLLPGASCSSTLGLRTWGQWDAGPDLGCFPGML